MLPWGCYCDLYHCHIAMFSQLKFESSKSQSIPKNMVLVIIIKLI